MKVPGADFIITLRERASLVETGLKSKLEKAAQGKPSAKYRPTRIVVDAALRRIGKSKHGGHKIANISVNCQRI